MAWDTGTMEATVATVATAAMAAMAATEDTEDTRATEDTPDILVTATDIMVERQKKTTRLLPNKTCHQT
uniref:Putative secreted protein n=1 Tax=Ixodes ricinus TaxID=34613 RepID=A0A6B0TWS0_IXORI